MTAEELAKGYNYAKLLGKDSNEFTLNLLNNIETQKDTLKVSVKQRDAYKDIVSLSARTKFLLGGSEKAIVASYLSAKKLGVELDKVLETSRSLLDLDQSLQQEMELFLLTGKQFDFNQMRIMAMTQNMQGLAQMQGQLSSMYLDDAKNNVLVNEKLLAMGYDVLGIEDRKRNAAKNGTQIQEDAVKIAQESQKSFAEALTNFNRYLLAIKSQGGKTFFELGQKIDLFKAKILGGISGAIGRSVDTFINKNGAAIGTFSDNILKVFNRITKGGGILELLIGKIFKFFIGDGIDPNKGLMGSLNKLFGKGGLIDRTLTDLEDYLSGKKSAPKWVEDTKKFFEVLKTIFEKIFDGILKYANTLKPLKGEDVKKRREELELEKKNYNSLPDDKTKELETLTRKKGEDDAAVANRINNANVDAWKKSWLGEKINAMQDFLKDAVFYLKLIAGSVAVYAGFRLFQGVRPLITKLPFIKPLPVKPPITSVKPFPKPPNNYAGTGSRSAQAMSQNRVSGKFSSGFKPTTTNVPTIPAPATTTTTLGTNTGNILKPIGNILKATKNVLASPVLAPITVGLGAYFGAQDAKNYGMSKGEGATYGALTGNVHTGSVFSSHLGIEQGSAGDKALGVLTAMLQGGMIGAAIGGGSTFWAGGAGSIPGAVIGAVTAGLAEGFKIFTEGDRIKEMQKKQAQAEEKEKQRQLRAQQDIKNKQINDLQDYYFQQKKFLEEDLKSRGVSFREQQSHIKKFTEEFQKTLKTQGVSDEITKAATSGMPAISNEKNATNIIGARINTISLERSHQLRGHFASVPLFVYVMGGKIDAYEFTGFKRPTLPVYGTGTSANDIYSPPTTNPRTLLIGNRKFNINKKDYLVGGPNFDFNQSNKGVKLAPFGTYSPLDLVNFPKEKSFKQTKPESKFNLPSFNVDKYNTLKENTQQLNFSPPSPSTFSSQTIQSLNELEKTLKTLANTINKPQSTPPIQVTVELDKQKVGQVSVEANNNYKASKNGLTRNPYSYGMKV
jgi:hypothetical protein